MKALICIICLAISLTICGCGNQSQFSGNMFFNTPATEIRKTSQKYDWDKINEELRQREKEQEEETRKSATQNGIERQNNYREWHDSYDLGYDSVMDGDDYDLDRYNRDSDYANGVDDAIGDYYEEYGEEFE